MRVTIVPPPADLFVNSTIGNLRFRQALRQAVAVSGRMGRRLRRSRRVSRRASGIAGESEAQSGQAKQSHFLLLLTLMLLDFLPVSRRLGTGGLR